MTIEYLLPYTAIEIENKLGQIDNKLDTAALESVIETALTEAKASGKFDGANGSDGISIIASEINNDGELVLSFSDGTYKTLGVVVGADGQDGVSVTHSWDGTTLTVTSASGTSSVDLKGQNGYTPIKGTDYWTEADKNEIKEYVKDEIPTNISAFNNDKGYLTSIPDEYITETELNEKGYLTEVELTPEQLKDIANDVAESQKMDIVNSTEEMVDTTKNYILDGFIYSYMSKNFANPESTGDDGWRKGYRINGNGGIEARSDTTVSNLIPCTQGDIIQVKGATFRSGNDRIALYATDSTGSAITPVVGYCNNGVTTSNGDIVLVEPANLETTDGFTSFVIPKNENSWTKTYVITGFRFAMQTPSDPKDIIVYKATKDENNNIVQSLDWVNTGISASSKDYGEDISKIETDVETLKEATQELKNKIENTETTDIPSYWKDEIAEKTQVVKDLQALGGKNCVSFVWASDTHIPDSDTDNTTNIGRTKDLGKLMAKMLDNCEIPLAIISGDINSRGSYQTEELFTSSLTKILEHLAPLWGSNQLLLALGNHDGCYGNGNTEGSYVKQYSPEKLWQIFFRSQALDFRRVFSDDGLYYYVDNIPQKTRFIILNSHFGGESENGYSINDRFNTSCYGQAQLDWFADTALDMPEGYSAVIVAHAPPSITYTVDKQQLIGIINAYCTKDKFNGSYTEGVEGWSKSKISVNYGELNEDGSANEHEAKGDIIAMFAGHIHWDKIDTTTMACPIITIIAAGATPSEHHKMEEESTPTRTFDTNTETSFDVVTINKATRTISCTRIGAGESREIQY